MNVFADCSEMKRQGFSTEDDFSHATRLYPDKEKLVKAWVDEYLHFGTIVTSRVGGIHSLLKSYVNISTFNLIKTSGAITRAITN